MVIIPILFNNNSPYAKEISYSAVMNFGRKRQAEENDNFSFSKPKFKEEELIKKIAEARQKGEAREVTCKNLRISAKTYTKYINLGNLPKKTQQYITPEKKQAIKKMVAEGKTYKEIADFLGISKSIVRDTVRRNRDFYGFAKKDIYPQKYTDEQRKQLLEEIQKARKAGELREETLKRLNISEWIYKELVRAANLPMRKTIYIDENKKQMIKKLVEEGKTYKEIADYLDISTDIIGDTIRRNHDFYGFTKRAVYPKKYTEEQRKHLIEEIQKARKAGEFRTETLKRLGIKEWMYKDLVRSANLPLRKTIYIDENKKQMIKKLMAEGKTYKEIADFLGISKSIVRDTVRRNHDFYGFAKKVTPSAKDTDTFQFRIVSGNSSDGQNVDKTEQPKAVFAKLPEKNLTSDNNIGKKSKSRLFNCDLINRHISNLEKVNNYNKQIKEEIEDIIDRPSASPADSEEKKEALENLRKEVTDKSLDYDMYPNTREYRIFQSLLKMISTKLKNVELEMARFDKQEGSSSLKNPTWLSAEDFENKLFSPAQILRTSVIANCDPAEIEEANTKLKAAYPEECVIWIDFNYDTLNTNNPNEQKYIIKGRFYESKDGKTFGQFGTNKKFLIEFLSDRKHLYKNFIDNLIANRNKIALA